MKYTINTNITMSQTAIAGGNLGDILAAGEDAATSSDTLKNVAVSALAAGITAGATTYANIATNGAITAGNAANATLSQQATTALYESAISTTTSTAVQSAINGDSFSEALEQGGINILVGALGNVGAKQIGQLAHGSITENGDGTLVYNAPAINRTEQLLLHAGLGAGLSALSGDDALSGAVSGVIGEIIGSELRDAGIDKQTGSQLAGLAGGFSAIFTGNVVGLDDNEIASNMYSGQRIGINAALYNAYLAERRLKGVMGIGYYLVPESEKLDLKNKELEHEQWFFEDKIGGNLGLFNDGKVRADSEENLKLYKRSTDPQDGWYDDKILRQAIENVVPEPYSLLGDKNNEKYNCQDYVDDVRQEYNKLYIDYTIKNNPLLNINKK